jgi:hypothetical protein
MMEISGKVPISAVRGNEAGHGYHPGIGEKFSHLANPPDIFFSIFRRKSQVFIQPVAHIVAIENISQVSETDKLIFKGKSRGAFP